MKRLEKNFNEWIDNTSTRRFEETSKREERSHVRAPFPIFTNICWFNIDFEHGIQAIDENHCAPVSELEPDYNEDHKSENFN